jgi:hypothetical protein
MNHRDYGRNFDEWWEMLELMASHSLCLLFCIPLQHVSQPEAHVPCEGYYVVITINIHVERT